MEQARAEQLARATALTRKALAAARRGDIPGTLDALERRRLLPTGGNHTPCHGSGADVGIPDAAVDELLEAERSLRLWCLARQTEIARHLDRLRVGQVAARRYGRSRKAL